MLFQAYPTYTCFLSDIYMFLIRHILNDIFCSTTHYTKQHIFFKNIYMFLNNICMSYNIIGHIYVMHRLTGRARKRKKARRKFYCGCIAFYLWHSSQHSDSKCKFLGTKSHNLQKSEIVILAWECSTQKERVWKWSWLDKDVVEFRLHCPELSERTGSAAIWIWPCRFNRPSSPPWWGFRLGMLRFEKAEGESWKNQGWASSRLFKP